MNRREHWEKVYTTRSTEKLGWYAPHLEASIAWIKELDLALEAPIIDIGGGASTLVDDLLEAGYLSLSVLDISEVALAAARERLGKRSGQVNWLIADITTIELPAERYLLWHDRAVFHFLTESADRHNYRQSLTTALKPGGHVIIGTFAPEAPPRCSGLPVRRYGLPQLADELGRAFELEDQLKEMHVTPGGIEQMYQYCLFRKIADDNH